MPRKARPITTPGGGDCFFHVVAHNRGQNVDSVPAALVERRAVAAYLAHHLYKPPYDDLATLANYVLQADNLDAFLYFRLHLKTTEEAQTLQRLWPDAAAPDGGPANGFGCPLAAWIVWLQHDAAEIENLRGQDLGSQALQATRFLTYTLWGDMGLAARAVNQLYNRPVQLYTPEHDDEDTSLENPINFFYTTAPNHFSAVRFFEAEVALWRDRVLSETYLESELDPIEINLSCRASTSSSTAVVGPYVVVNPASICKFVKRKRDISTQYKPPPMTLPADVELRRMLCLRILRHWREIMGTRALLRSVEPIDFSTFNRPPIYVISANRSRWLGRVFWSRDLFVGNLVINAAKRAIIFIVDAEEAANYRANLNIGELAQQGVYVLACSGGGFGMSWSRHCAIQHARQSGLKRLWILDDNIERMGSMTTPLDDLDDSMVQYLPVFSYSSRSPFILERAVGFNLNVLKKMGYRNFCPYFAYNKDDLSLEAVLEGCDRFCYGEIKYPHCGYTRPGLKKADKTGIEKDSAQAKTKTHNPKALAYRGDIEGALSALDIWRTEEQHEVDILECAPTGDVMKWHSHIMWAILHEDPELAIYVATEWFSDKALTVKIKYG